MRLVCVLDSKVGFARAFVMVFCIGGASQDGLKEKDACRILVVGSDAGDQDLELRLRRTANPIRILLATGDERGHAPGLVQPKQRVFNLGFLPLLLHRASSMERELPSIAEPPI